MTMKKGVILEITRSYLVMLTPDGEFIKARKQGSDYEIGSEIYFQPVKESKYPQRLFTAKWTAGAAMAAVLLLFAIIGTSLMKAEKTFAYVSIDVNPSIELAINEKYKVISAEAFNSEGAEVLSRIRDIKRSSIQDAANEIIKQFSLMGYMDQEEELIVAAVPVTKEKNGRFIHLEEELETLRPAHHPDVALEVIEATLEERNKANEQGLTVGTFIAEERKKDLKIKTEENKEKKQKVNSHKKQDERTNSEKVKPENGYEQQRKNYQETKNEQETLEKHEEKYRKEQEKSYKEWQKNQRKELEKREKREEKENKQRVKQDRKMKHEQEKAERKAKKEQEKTEKNRQKDRDK